MNVVESARRLAFELLAEELPDRWLHVTAVAQKAAKSAYSLRLSNVDAEALVASAWLHDVGYASSVATTGFHPLDGAFHLENLAFPARITALVANHSCAAIEAKMRGLGVALDEFRDENTLARDCLWHADLTTGPTGQVFSFAERLAEIRDRYGHDHLVSRVWKEAEPEARLVVIRVESMLRQAGRERQ